MICEKCKFQLSKSEENFALCPHCAEIIEKNLPPNSNDRLIIYAESVRLKKIKKISEYIGIVVICVLMIFVLEYVIYEMVNSYNSDIWKASSYDITRESIIGEGLPTVVAICIYEFTKKKRLYIFKEYKLNLLLITLIKWLIYLIAIFILFNTFYNNRYNWMLYRLEKVSYKYTAEELRIGLSMLMKKHEIRIIYSFLTCAILDIVDMFINLKVYNINRKIKEYGG